MSSQQASTGPSNFGRFRVRKTVGRGGMGRVYLAQDPLIGRDVAIKVISADPDLDDDQIEEIQARFQREFQSAGTLSHPNIVTVYDVGQEGDETFIAMEYLPGENWSDILKSGRPLGYGEIAEFAARMCSALDYAHVNGIVHRDIKPANVLVASNGEPKITDFGVAKLTSTNLTRTGSVVGTPAYMSPEQITGKPVSGASDQFSVAVILYQMLTQQLPFTGENPTTILYKIVHEEPPPPRTTRGDLPPGIDQVLMRALAKQPEDRFASCSDLALALRDALGVSQDAIDLDLEHTQIIDRRQRQRSRRSSGGIGKIAVAVGLLAAIALGAWTYREELIGLLPAGIGGKPDGPIFLTRTLSVNSGEPGAMIWRGGVSTGLLTPAEITIEGTEGDEILLELRRGEVSVARTSLLLMQEMPPVWQAIEQVPAETFAVASEPAGAEVWIDDVRIDGATPMQIELVPGERYKVRVELDQYHPESTTFAFPEGLDDRIRASRRFYFPLRPRIPPGHLGFESAYAVEVRIDGRTLPPAQKHRIALQPGTYEALLIARDVYLEETRRVTIESARDLQLELPPAVEVRVAAQPGNCRVFINGRFVDETPFTLRVVPNSYEFRFDWPALGESRSRLERITRDSTQIFNKLE